MIPVLWTACKHGGEHLVDLTWPGAWYGLAMFFAGFWAGRTSSRPPSKWDPRP